jgi:hypothetical protein
MGRSKSAKKGLIYIIYAGFMAFFTALFFSAKPLKPGLPAIRRDEKHAI